VPEFVIGQRWISNSELSLGLGTVVNLENRDVTIDFYGSEETRVYAADNAPLSRISFNLGDKIKDLDGNEYSVENIQDNNGLLIYLAVDAKGNQQVLDESQLDHHTQLNRPAERLFSRQIDDDKWFELRYQTLLQKNRLAHSDLFGLSGVRTSLIPHQLYIAHEVANRYAPRVLLADEVGLGKTIEAGLILHHQLLTERAKRILIILPESLIHQWLVEMLRRFNLYFSLFDAERCDEMSAQDPDINPFMTEQLVICSLDFLRENPNRFEQVLISEWDLMVVDEAHHLQWSKEAPSIEYQIVEELANVTKGVLLLTATPEQLGKTSHFARLRLLDADRFSNYEQFLEEENSYEPIANAIESLLNDDIIDVESYKLLNDILQEHDHKDLLEQLKNTNDQDQKEIIEQSIIEHLIDRHGTGRVLFRNTRHAVKGFPKRKVTLYPLALPDQYKQFHPDLKEMDLSEPQLLLCQELLFQAFDEEAKKPWFTFDSRVPWLIEHLKALSPQKVLVIASSPDTVMDLAEALRVQAGISAAVFHEGISIVERDRAAAYFADEEDGTQILLCSEIGSEGRNFQFAHHLVLFDLPANPDLLEQRIGRLDRIGQTSTVNIHVPYIKDSASEVMAHWYHDGLGALQQTCPAGNCVFKKFKTDLIFALHQQDLDNSALIANTANELEEVNYQLQQGRDRLLEHNSCRPLVAKDLANRCEKQDKTTLLPEFMEQVFDCFGVDIEYNNETSMILNQSEYMVENFPYLPDEGMTITYDRDVALTTENYHYLTWEHPMVLNSMDMVLSAEHGNTALIAVKYPLVKAGTVLIECIYILESMSNTQLQTSRYLPPTTIRVVIDENGKQHQEKLTHPLINKIQSRINKKIKGKIINMKDAEIHNIMDISKDIAKQAAPSILKDAHKNTQKTLLEEIGRLKALKRVNPNIRQVEIDFFEQQYQQLNKILDSAMLRLDSVRVLINL
jgi:ATP-dependent helicase HepA